MTRSYSTSAIDFKKPEKALSVLGWNTIDKWKSRQDLLPPKSILREEGIISTLYISRSKENNYFLCLLINTLVKPTMQIETQLWV